MDLKSSNSRLIPGIGRIPFPAYRGDEPYIFVSYAHKNAEAVFAEINRWNKQGYNIWYDEGIAPGNEWEEEIAKALENCRLFVVFITPDSIESKNCRDEIYYALDSGLPIIAIYLTWAEHGLVAGLLMTLGVLLVIGLAVFLSYRSAMRGRLSKSDLILKDTQEAAVPVTDALRSWIGKEAVVATPLRPAGFVDVGGQRLSAASSGDFLEKGVRVQITGAEGDHLVVRPL